MGRRMGRIAATLAAVLTMSGIGALGAAPAHAGMGFTCYFDLSLGSGVRVDICLERVYAPGLQVRAITWLENGSSQTLTAQFSSTIPDVGGTFCGLGTTAPGGVRACQSNLYWDFDGPDDRAASMITWRLGSGSFTVDNVASPVG
ncbi:MAG TPA: hypothetical protein VGD67_26290 [Pseudonocardiaceae bacterium]